MLSLRFLRINYAEGKLQEESDGGWRKAFVEERGFSEGLNTFFFFTITAVWSVEA